MFYFVTSLIRHWLISVVPVCVYGSSPQNLALWGQGVQ